jgi:hypothetical protein
MAGAPRSADPLRPCAKARSSKQVRPIGTRQDRPLSTSSDVVPGDTEAVLRLAVGAEPTVGPLQALIEAYD